MFVEIIGNSQSYSLVEEIFDSCYFNIIFTPFQFLNLQNFNFIQGFYKISKIDFRLRLNFLSRLPLLRK